MQPLTVIEHSALVSPHVYDRPSWTGAGESDGYTSFISHLMQSGVFVTGSRSLRRRMDAQSLFSVHRL